MLSQSQQWKVSIPQIILYVGFLRLSAEEKPTGGRKDANGQTIITRSDYDKGKTTQAPDDKTLWPELLFLHRPQHSLKDDSIRRNLMEVFLTEHMTQKRNKTKTADNFTEEVLNYQPKAHPVLPNITYRKRTRLKFGTTKINEQISNEIVQEYLKNENNFLTFGKRRLLSIKHKVIPKKKTVIKSKVRVNNSLHSTVKPNMSTTLEPSSNVTTDDYKEVIVPFRRGLQRSEDAMWGLACTIFILVLLVWAVWFSGMCKPSTDEFVHAEYSTAIQHMSVREMLKNRARFLPIFKSRRHRGQRYEEIPLVDNAVASDNDDDNEDMVYDRRWESIDANT